MKQTLQGKHNFKNKNSSIFSEIREKPWNKSGYHKKEHENKKFFEIKNVIAKIKTSVQELEVKAERISQKIEQKLEFLLWRIGNESD